MNFSPVTNDRLDPAVIVCPGPNAASAHAERPARQCLGEQLQPLLVDTAGGGAVLRDGLPGAEFRRVDLLVLEGA